MKHGRKDSRGFLAGEPWLGSEAGGIRTTGVRQQLNRSDGGGNTGRSRVSELRVVEFASPGFAVDRL